MGIIWEGHVGVFILVTVILGGGAAYLTGRAMALAWKQPLQLAVYTALLALAVRFIHFALFDETLLSVHYYVVDLIVLLVLAGLGFRVTRTGQMVGQYRWLYQRQGGFAWRERPGAGN